MKAELISYDLRREFKEDNLTLYAIVSYTDKTLSLFYHEGNFKDPMVLKYCYSTPLHTPADLESALSFTFENYLLYSNLVWRAVSWLTDLSENPPFQNSLWESEEEETELILRIPNFLDDMYLEAHIGLEYIHFIVKSNDKSRFTQIDLYQSEQVVVNDFGLWAPPLHALPFREDEHNKILAHFNASKKDILASLHECILENSLPDWLAGIVPPTSGGAF